jgi:hypothetical protein
LPLSPLSNSRKATSPILSSGIPLGLSMYPAHEMIPAVVLSFEIWPVTPNGFTAASKLALKSHRIVPSDRYRHVPL